MLNRDDEVLEFRAWLRRNKMHFIFGKYTPDEVALLARLVGFDVGIVCNELSHWTHALAGVPFRKLLKQKHDQFMIAANIAVDLSDQWKALGAYLIDGKTFDEGGTR